MPLTFSWLLPVPDTEIQRQLMALQLQKMSRVWRVRGGWALELAMKAALFANVTEPSCAGVSANSSREVGYNAAYGNTSKLIDGVRGIGKITGKQCIGRGGEVGCLRVGQQVVEGVDNGGSLERQDAGDDGGCFEGRLGARGSFLNITLLCRPLATGQRRGDGTCGERQGNEGGRELHVC